MSQPSAVASASLARSSPRCQLWTSLPRFPSGFSRLWSGPATKPSSEIDMWQVVRGIASSSAIDFLLLAFCNRLQHTATAFPRTDILGNLAVLCSATCNTWAICYTGHACSASFREDLKGCLYSPDCREGSFSETHSSKLPLHTPL